MLSTFKTIKIKTLTCKKIKLLETMAHKFGEEQKGIVGLKLL
jgi:hypothetical protein